MTVGIIEKVLRSRAITAARLQKVAAALGVAVAGRPTKDILATEIAATVAAAPKPFVEALQQRELRALVDALGANASGSTNADYREAILDALDRDEGVEEEAERPAWVRDRQRLDLQYPEVHPEWGVDS